MTYDSVKNHKKQGFTLSLQDIFFEAPQGEVKLTLPSRLRVDTRGTLIRWVAPQSVVNIEFE